MAIPSRQIGWSAKANLLWEISKQLELMTQVAGKVYIGPNTPNYGQWTLVTDGDGVVLVDDLANQEFTFVGPDDNTNNGWVYLTQYFATETCFEIPYNWTSFDEGTNVDRPVYWLSETQPTGQPGDITSKVDDTPAYGIWNVTIPAGQWFSIGIYSTDSCCGRGFLTISFDQIECTTTTTTTTAPPASTLYLSSLSVINACAQTGPIYPITGITYNSGTGLCDSVAMTSNDILGLSGNTTYYASDGTNARAGFKAGGVGVDLITFTGPCFAC